MLKMWLRARGSSANLLADRSGIAATEFAVIVPVMLLMFFGLVEFSSGVAADRKVTLVARTLSDLTSQSTTVSDIDLSNFGQAAKAVMTPYSAAPLKSMISELYVEPTTLNARVQWTRAWTIDASGNILFGSSSHNPKDIVEIPPALKIAGTYLIYSEVSYRYTPAVGYVMGKAGVNLSDLSYTRPRQSSCVMYKTTVCTTL
jgi:Flp pilus assembly protein TadG